VTDAEHCLAAECDVAAVVGPRIPAAVVCEILGVPEADQDMLIG
jgi:hydroxylation protein CepL